MLYLVSLSATSRGDFLWIWDRAEIGRETRTLTRSQKPRTPPYCGSSPQTHLRDMGIKSLVQQGNLYLAVSTKYPSNSDNVALRRPIRWSYNSMETVDYRVYTRSIPVRWGYYMWFQVWRQYLSYRQYRVLQHTAVPQALKGVLSQETYDKSQAYSRAKVSISISLLSFRHDMDFSTELGLRCSISSSCNTILCHGSGTWRDNGKQRTWDRSSKARYFASCFPFHI